MYEDPPEGVYKEVVTVDEAKEICGDRSRLLLRSI